MIDVQIDSGKRGRERMDYKEIERVESGSPGLVVMGGDSRSEGSGFQSQHCIQHGHLFKLICCKIFNVLSENDWNKQKDGPYKKIVREREREREREEREKGET